MYKISLSLIFVMISISCFAATRNMNIDISATSHIVITGGVNMYDFQFVEDYYHPEEEPTFAPQRGGTNAECAIDFALSKSIFVEAGVITWSNTDFSSHGSTLTVFYKPGNHSDSKQTDILFGIGSIPDGKRFIVRGYEKNKNIYLQFSLNACHNYPAWGSLNVGIKF